MVPVCSNVVAGWERILQFIEGGYDNEGANRNLDSILHSLRFLPRASGVSEAGGTREG
jgi:hypothetical protein